MFTGNRGRSHAYCISQSVASDPLLKVSSYRYVQSAVPLAISSRMGRGLRGCDIAKLEFISVDFSLCLQGTELSFPRNQFFEVENLSFKDVTLNDSYNTHI